LVGHRHQQEERGCSRGRFCHGCRGRRRDQGTTTGTERGQEGCEFCFQQPRCVIPSLTPFFRSFFQAKALAQSSDALATSTAVIPETPSASVVPEANGKSEKKEKSKKRRASEMGVDGDAAPNGDDGEKKKKKKKRESLA
jgi:hypothetical protein